MSELNNTGENNGEEYITFQVKAKDGSDVEMAVVDEFEYERKNYVAAALVTGDEINDENVYIFRVKLKATEGFEVEKITAPGEYEKISQIYMELLEEENGNA